MAFDVGLTSFLLALLLTPVVRSVGRRLDVVDRPNYRSSHENPTPRGGGVAISIAVVAGVVFAGRAVVDREALVLLASGLVLGGVGIFDDLRGLSVRFRLIAQAAVAAIAMMFGGLGLSDVEFLHGLVISLDGLGPILVTLWLVGVTNAYNFMDGINGIAVLESIICASVFAILALRVDDPGGAALAVAVAGAALGFLPWNFPRASIFMGDSGSLAMGFLLGALSLRLVRSGVPALVIVLPLSPFLFDTSVTLIRRVLRRERITAPHRTHFYQRLVISGWSHAGVTLLWSGLAAAFSILALAAGSSRMGQIIGAAAALAVLSCIAFWISRRSPLGKHRGSDATQNGG